MYPVSVDDSSFNRNIVECKDGTLEDRQAWKKRFNRNIVECKAASKLPRAFLRLRFNRNIVECKATKRIDPVDATLVLIETLWNVKQKCRKGI